MHEVSSSAVAAGTVEGCSKRGGELPGIMPCRERSTQIVWGGGGGGGRVVAMDVDQLRWCGWCGGRPMRAG